MMCSNPYLKTPTGVTNLHYLRENTRLACTPFGCGQCLQCRINKAREWKHRIILEGSLYEHSTFITLTYSDTYLPKDGNLNLVHLQKFFKRLRKNENVKFRYYAVGEYGAAKRQYHDSKGAKRTTTQRPHYHAMLFGIRTTLKDKIQNAWAQGRTQSEPICNGRTGYIVGYTTEKLTKKNYAKENNKRNQFATMSRNEGGIGLQAALNVADTIKANPKWEKRIITSFQYGKKSMPLGKYLAQKVNERLGITEDEFETLLLERQTELFETHVFNQSSDTRTYYDKLLGAEAQKRLNRKARYNNFKRKKQI